MISYVVKYMEEESHFIGVCRVSAATIQASNNALRTTTKLYCKAHDKYS